MTQYDNTNRFSLFKNDRKAEDRDADFTGTLNIEGVEYFVDAWKPRQPGGKLVLSGRVKPKARQPAAPQAQPDLTPRRPNGRPAPSYADLDDDIPF
jgi:hypothetical protein